MSKYLYGAAVQGIQDFIFRTNKLKEIVGASELVEQICTVAFDDYRQNGEDVVKAAGNIKYIFNQEDDCKKAVCEFPKKVMTMAPCITISQAVVILSDNFNDGEFDKAIDEIEGKLKVQRNKPTKSVISGLIGIKRANNTGLPIVKVKPVFDKDGKEVLDTDGKQKMLYLDDATSKKLDGGNLTKLCENSFGSIDGKLASEISDITDKNDWIAIIHADGNGLGQIVQKVGKKKDKFRTFSQTLDVATQKAAQTAYEKVIKDAKRKDNVIPARPVVLSGDDMTIIIRGDLAVEYAKEFIISFENNTGRDESSETGKVLGNILREFNVFEEGKNYMTACAGIAFIKSSYPFYYGYQLAEELCGQSKKDTKYIAKDGKPQKHVGLNGKEETLNYLPASCLMFHKVQDSFVTDYKEIIRRELTAYDNLSFMAGPYYISECPAIGKHMLEDLNVGIENLAGENGEGVRSGIRNWISLRLKNKNVADQRRGRMLQVFYDIFSKEDEDKSESEGNIVIKLTKETKTRFADKEMTTCMAYDVLAYYTIKNQQTNE